jgi:hypothetical protein
MGRSPWLSFQSTVDLSHDIFLPLSIENFVINILPVYGPETYLASLLCGRLIWTGTGKHPKSGTNIWLTFIYQRKIHCSNVRKYHKGHAILIMSDGATAQNLLSTKRLCSMIESNAKDWFTYAIETCGRHVRNGDLCVVGGADKVSSWAMATSACNTGQTAF